MCAYLQVFEVGGERAKAEASDKGERRSGLSFQLGEVFRALDRAKATLELESYSLSQTTLEQACRRRGGPQGRDSHQHLTAPAPRNGRCWEFETGAWTRIGILKHRGRAA